MRDVAAVVDDRLEVRVRSERALRYTQHAGSGAAVGDRPDHVRAASGMAFAAGRLLVVQDDAAFLAVVDGDTIDAVALPYAPGGRQRFEASLGNKLDKLDLEACVVVGDQLWAFGSGSLPVREEIVRTPLAALAPVLVAAGALYAAVRAAIGSPAINVEGAACCAGELWLCHRGNTGPGDPGPAIARLPLAEVRAFLDGGPPPRIAGVDRYRLGTAAGRPLGFTAAAACGDRLFYLAAAEASPDAIADGLVLGSQLGVLDGDVLRAAPLTGPGGRPIKAEALAFDPDDHRRAWIAVDPDDPDRPAPLYEVELIGPW